MCRLPAEQRRARSLDTGTPAASMVARKVIPKCSLVFEVCACFLEGHRHRRNAQLVPDLVRDALQGHPAFCGGVKRSAAGAFSSASR